MAWKTSWVIALNPSWATLALIVLQILAANLDKNQLIKVLRITGKLKAGVLIRFKLNMDF